MALKGRIIADETDKKQSIMARARHFDAVIEDLMDLGDMTRGDLGLLIMSEGINAVCKQNGFYVAKGEDGLLHAYQVEEKKG